MFSCGSFCSVQNKEKDTVNVLMPPAIEEEILEAEEAATATAGEEVEEDSAAKFVDKWLLYSEELIASQNRAAVTQWKHERQERELARRQAAEEEARKELAALQDEEAARKVAEEAAQEAQKQEEAERAAEAAAREEAASQQELAAAAERKAAVQAFLKKHGYKGVCAPKKTFLKTTYPLHEAAKRADAGMVKMLLEEGASKAQKNSRGTTAVERAQKADKKGSHAEVIQLLCGKAAKAGGA